jgi:acetyl-CoA synthetase
MVPIKPGSAGIPLPGWDVEIVDHDGTPAAAGQKGIVIIKRPFPSLTPTIWRDLDRLYRPIIS